MKGLVGHGAPGHAVEHQGLAAEGGLVLRVGAGGGVTGADEQRTVVEDQQPAATVPAAGRGEALDQGSLVRRPGRSGVHLPDQDPHVGVALRVATGAGVEAAVAGEAGVDRQPHQPRLSRRPDQVGGHVQAADVAALDHRQPTRSLGDEQPARADRLHVPRVVEPGGDPLDPQTRGGLLRSAAGALRGRGWTTTARRRGWRRSGPRRSPARSGWERTPARSRRSTQPRG